MSVSGGGPLIDILDAEYEDSKKDRLEKHEERQKRKVDAQLGNLLKLMNEKWGRELLWDVLVDTSSLKLNPYTRNADTYYILGLQRQAKLCSDILKELDLNLYHKMEQEAYNRKKREEGDSNG